jgi:hypothetical protein
VHPPAPKLDEEQHVQCLQPHRLDRKKVTRENARSLVTEEHPPADSTPGAGPARARGGPGVSGSRWPTLEGRASPVPLELSCAVGTPMPHENGIGWTCAERPANVGTDWYRESALNLTWELSVPRIVAPEHAEQTRDDEAPPGGRCATTRGGGAWRP